MMRTPNSQFGQSYHRGGRVQIQRDGRRCSSPGLVPSAAAAAAVVDDLEVPRLEVTLAPGADALSVEGYE